MKDNTKAISKWKVRLWFNGKLRSKKIRGMSAVQDWLERKMGGYGWRTTEEVYNERGVIEIGDYTVGSFERA